MAECFYTGCAVILNQQGCTTAAGTIPGMELPRRARGSRTSALACISCTRKTMARRPRAHLPPSAYALPRREWHRHLDFQHVSPRYLRKFML